MNPHDEKPEGRPVEFLRLALSGPASEATSLALAALIDSEIADLDRASHESGVSFAISLRHRIAESPELDLSFLRFVSERCLSLRKASSSQLEALVEALPDPLPHLRTALSGTAPSWDRPSIELALRLGILPSSLVTALLSRRMTRESAFALFRDLLQIARPGLRESLVTVFATAWRPLGLTPVEVLDLSLLPHAFQKLALKKDALPDRFFGTSFRALRRRWHANRLRSGDIDTLRTLPAVRHEVLRASFLHQEERKAYDDRERILVEILRRLAPGELVPALESRGWKTPNPASVLEPSELWRRLKGQDGILLLRALFTQVPTSSWFTKLDSTNPSASRRRSWRLFNLCREAASGIESRHQDAPSFPLVQLAFNASRPRPTDEASSRRVPLLSGPALGRVVDLLGPRVASIAQQEGWPDAAGLSWFARHVRRGTRARSEASPQKSNSPVERRRLIRRASVAREICRAFGIDAVDLLTVLAAEAWKQKNQPPGTVFDSRYRTYTLPKKAGGTRTITEPEPHLKWLQRQLLDKAFSTLPLLDCVHGFRSGHSILTNALPHTGKRLVMNLDIDEFFPSVRHPLILRACGRLHNGRLSPRAVLLLADICSFRGALPTGAPTSPAVGNAVLAPVDAALLTVCARRGIAYTRYADDLTFSGGNEVRGVLPFVKELLSGLGLSLDEKKLNFFRRGRRQIVTGLVVNDRPGVPRRIRRRLRAAVHRRSQGLAPHWHEKEIDDASLAGRIAYIGLVHPEEARRLRARIGEGIPPAADSPGRTP